MTTHEQQLQGQDNDAPRGVVEKTWQITGYLGGYLGLYSAAEAWVTTDHPKLSTAESITAGFATTHDGYLPVSLGKFTTFQANLDGLPAQTRAEYGNRNRLSEERRQRIEGFLQELDFAPNVTFLFRQARRPQLVVASLMIDLGHINLFDPIRDTDTMRNRDILPGTSGIKRTADGNSFIGAPVLRINDRASLQPAPPKVYRGSVALFGGELVEIPKHVIPQQRRH